MIERIVNSPVLVVRDGKQVEPPIGKAFKFEMHEVEEIERLKPTAISKLPVAAKDAAVVAEPAATSKK